MRFLTPAYLLGGALIALPIVLHWLRRDRAPTVPFTAVRLLRAQPDRSIPAPAVPRSPVARSAHRGAPVAGGRVRATVRRRIAGDVATDHRRHRRSFSMGAPGRMARAREMARQAVADAGNDRVGLIAFDQRADVVAPVGSAWDARAAIDRIDVGFAGTHYGAVLDKATELLAQEARGRLVIVTDMQRGGFDGGIATVPDNVELIVRDVGGATANVAVTDVRVEARRVVATILNVGAGARQLQAGSKSPVKSGRSGRSTSERSLRLTSPSTASHRSVRSPLPSTTPRGMRRTTPAIRSTPREPCRECSSSAEVMAVETASTCRAGSRPAATRDRTSTSSSYPAVHSPPCRRMTSKEQSAIVLLSTHGVDRRVREPLRSFFEAGGGLLIAAANDVDGSVLSTALDWTPPLKSREHAGRGVLTATDLRHPIFRPFAAIAANLSQVTFERVWEVDPAKDWRVVARFTDGGAALLERTAGRGRILLFASDLDRRWNDFPLHSTYVPFLQESLRYLGARLPTSGSVLVSDVSLGVPAKPGVVDGDGRLIAVNVDQRESHDRPRQSHGVWPADHSDPGRFQAGRAGHGPADRNPTALLAIRPAAHAGGVDCGGIRRRVLAAREAGEDG